MDHIMNHLRYLYRDKNGDLLARDFIMDIDRVMEWNDSLITIQSQKISDRLSYSEINPNIIFLISKKLTYNHSRLNTDDHFHDVRQYGYIRASFWNYYDEICEFGSLRTDVIDNVRMYCDAAFDYLDANSGYNGIYVGKNISLDIHLYPSEDISRGFFRCIDHHLPVFTEDSDLYHTDIGSYLYESNIPDDNHDDDDDYDFDCDQKIYVSEYHSRRSEKMSDRRVNNGGFWIGLEIEKEDRDVLESIRLNEFKSAFPEWRKERDSSLSAGSGFELISPILPLNVDYISVMLKNSPILSRHINAKFTVKCGGHINISDDNREPDALYDDIAGYFPILAALYPSRCSNTFSKLYGKIKMKEGNSGRSAFNLRSDRIELRIFPAVRNVENLLFRARLIRYMMENPARYLSDVNMDDIRVLCNHIHDSEYKRIAFQDRISEYDSMIFQTEDEYQ
jgi:hypothetical protein